MKRQIRAFTLVELLVVVGIIALLTAMLMPALRKAREQALEVQCISNQRQIVLAAIMYANEWRSFPNTDGSWLDRVKGGRDSPKGMGVLAATKHLNPSTSQVGGLMFCPAMALPTWNWRQPGHVSRELTTNLSSGNDAYTTYVGKFCTFRGWARVGYPNEANLYMAGPQSARKISPILVADWWVGNTPIGHGEQGHRGRGVTAAFYDGSAKFIRTDEVYWVNGFGSNKMENRNPYSNFWYWARREYGDKK